MQLAGKRIIITGGARGIGETLVRKLVAEGAHVASMDVRDDLGRTVAASANAGGNGKARYFHCDVSSRSDVESAFAAAVEDLGGLDGMVNVAGIEQVVPADKITDEQWERMLAVNVTGTFLTNQVAFRHLKDKGGRILNFGSDAGLGNCPDAIHYSASKGAVMSMTRSLAAAWGRYNITVNAMVPAIKTPMFAEHLACYSEEEKTAFHAAMKHHIPIDGELGDPERDFAPVVVFMLTDGSRFMSGQLISVNGGSNGVR